MKRSLSRGLWILGGSLAVIFLSMFMESTHPWAWFGNEVAYPGERKNFRVSAYAPDYRLEHLMSESNRAFISENLDDLFLFSLPFSRNGRIDLDAAPNILMALQSFSKENFFITFGGGGRSDEFADFVSNSSALTTFSRDLIDLSRRFNRSLIGVDFDPETKLDDKEYSHLETLFQGIKSTFSAAKQHFEISLALHHWQDPGQKIYSLVDRVNLMTYDLSKKQHSSLSHTKQVVQQFLDRGLDTEKIFVGVPLYGRHETNPGAVKTFSELVKCDAENPLKNVLVKDIEKGFHYNGKKTLMNKVDFAKSAKLGGIFFWEAGQDCLKPKYSLIEAARQSLISPSNLVD